MYSLLVLARLDDNGTVQQAALTKEWMKVLQWFSVNQSNYLSLHHSGNIKLVRENSSRFLLLCFVIFMWAVLLQFISPYTEMYNLIRVSPWVMEFLSLCLGSTHLMLTEWTEICSKELSWTGVWQLGYGVETFALWASVSQCKISSCLLLSLFSHRLSVADKAVWFWAAAL